MHWNKNAYRFYRKINTIYLPPSKMYTYKKNVMYMRSRDTSEFCRKAPKSCDEIDVFTFTTVAAFPTRITTIITQTVYVVTSVTCDVACVYTVFPNISVWAGYKSYLSINMSFYDKYINISNCFLFPFNGIDAYKIPLQ